MGEIKRHETLFETYLRHISKVAIWIVPTVISALVTAWAIEKFRSREWGDAP
jgi:hypothetical protein